MEYTYYEILSFINKKKKKKKKIYIRTKKMLYIARIIFKEWNN